MSLSKVLEEINQVKVYAEEDTESGPIETLSGRRGRKNQAIEKLKTLKSEYKQSLIDSAAFIIVTGDKRDEFTSVAVENFKCFSRDPNDFYEDLADRIPPTLYQGQASVSTIFDVLGRHLEDKAREIGIIGYPQMIFKQEYRVTLKDKSDLASLIKRAINEQVGSEIVGVQAIASIVDPAIARGHGAKVTPIIFSTNEESLALNLKSALRRLKPVGVFLIVAGKGTKALRAAEGVISVKDLTAENVKQVLKTISEATVR